MKRVTLFAVMLCLLVLGLFMVGLAISSPETHSGSKFATISTVGSEVTQDFTEVSNFIFTAVVNTILFGVVVISFIVILWLTGVSTGKGIRIFGPFFGQQHNNKKSKTC